MPRSCSVLGAMIAVAAIAIGPVRAWADVPFYTVYFDNAVEVKNQEAFPDWMVIAFPSAPPSGRPAAWPALVEAGFQTEIDRRVLGTPKLWILKRSALPELEAAAHDNDDQLDGPVAKLLGEKGVECLTLKLEEKANLPGGAPSGRLFTYSLEGASEGKCSIKFVDDDHVVPEFKRGPSWARFRPRKRAASAASASASAAAPLATASVSVLVSAAPSASTVPAASAASPGRAAEVPAPKSATGCGACAARDPGDAGSAIAASLLALGAMLRAWPRRRVRPPRGGRGGGAGRGGGDGAAGGASAARSCSRRAAK